MRAAASCCIVTWNRAKIRFHSVVDLQNEYQLDPPSVQRSTYSILSAFSRKSLDSPAISGSATDARTGCGSVRKTSSARNVESRSSSCLMTTVESRRSDATTRSLKRMLNELAEDKSRASKS